MVCDQSWDWSKDLREAVALMKPGDRVTFFDTRGRMQTGTVSRVITTGDNRDEVVIRHGGHTTRRRRTEVYPAVRASIAAASLVAGFTTALYAIEIARSVVL